MPLQIRPIKVKRSYYLLVPKNIADLTDIDSSNTFTLTVENEKGGMSLLYEKNKAKGGDLDA